MPGVGAFRWIPLEFCEPFSMLFGKNRSIADRKTWFSRIGATGLYTGVICCGATQANG
jgi:hypothetical protein